jgi:hypothetical protein
VSARAFTISAFKKSIPMLSNTPSKKMHPNAPTALLTRVRFEAGIAAASNGAKMRSQGIEDSMPYKNGPKRIIAINGHPA